MAGQCGGIGWTGFTTCTQGWFCQVQGAYYSQCAASPIPSGDQVPDGQCAGQTYTGLTQCSPGYFCSFHDIYYSQCIPVPYTVGLSTSAVGSLSTLVASSSPSVVATVLVSVQSSSKVSSSSTTASSISTSRTLSSSSSIKSTSLVSTLSSLSSVKASSSSSVQTLSSSSSVKSTSLVSTLTLSSSVKASSISTIRTVSPSSTTNLTSIVSSPSSSTKSTGPTNQQSLFSSSSSSIKSTRYSATLSSVTSSSGVSNSKSTSAQLSSTKQSSTSISSVQVSSTKSSSTFTTSIVSSTKSSSTSTLLSSLSSTTPLSCKTSNPPPPSAGKVQFAGINIPGCEFGGDSNGYQVPTGPSRAYCPLGPTHGLPDGPGQMVHFVGQDGFNIFRLPVGWQFITNSQYNAISTLDPTNSAMYDFLVQSCLATGAYCLIDFHNFARFNGAIIGQRGPTDAVWAAIASKYKGQSKVVFGLMNEPHDVPSITTWAASCQAAVTAIRNAGATTQIILLPGNDWTSAQTFVTDGSGPALSNVTNPDGSFTNLVFDVHKYLDSDNSGTHIDCVDSDISTAFAPLAQWLRCNGRQALLSEIGGGSVASCELYVCEAIAYLNANSDVYLGYLGWAAGSFDTSYILAETPTYSNGIWTDT
ncbi:cellulase-domain-containing protein [Mollisia scopiformis]|uniref:Endoglucanase EG-II n=1 Tax=Mollisia scopiformis TaxID=149040 RepID=A0A194XDE5_MOLSC|nr:cellulase-domain-containing protein [Mollisia scopiformis]KUJ18200.1 cellulase-domain-containing protein [Mollisia scopiformis]